MSSVVLVTGVSRLLAGRLAGRLAADPAIERIIGVDDVAPARADLDQLGRTEFIRLDIRQPMIAQVIANAEVDTVVHASVTSNPYGPGARPRSSEAHVMGAMQLVAACQRAESVKRFVLKSSTACYGSSARDPAVFTEDMAPVGLSRSGFVKDAVDVEGYVLGLGRVRPDIAVTVLRMAQVMGPFIDTPLTRFFQLPVSPTVLGVDPRLQFLHEADAVEVLRRAASASTPGIFNVAGDGVLSLSQAIRRAGRLSVPVPAPLLALAGRLLNGPSRLRRGAIDLSAEQAQFLNVGRVVSTDKLKSEFGYQPRYDTAAAFQSFLSGRPVGAVLDPALLRFAESSLARLLQAQPVEGAVRGVPGG